MTDMEFDIYWGLCLAFMVAFGIWMGILNLKQKKADRKREQEAERRKALWDSNVKEYADLFEGGATK